MSKRNANRPNNGVGNYMAVRVTGIIGDPNGNREQRRAAARLAKRRKQPGGTYQPKDR